MRALYAVLALLAVDSGNGMPQNAACRNSNSANARSRYTLRRIPEWMTRSRPVGSQECRGKLFDPDDGLFAVVLMVGELPQAVAAGVVTALTRLFFGGEIFDLKLANLAPEINRWLSTGGAQETTLIDESLEHHREFKKNPSGERRAFAGFGSILHYLGLAQYTRVGDDPFHVKDGHVIEDVKKMCVALTNPFSSLVGHVTIEAFAMLSFFMAAGDKDTRRLLIYIMAHCFFGACVMQVANILCGNMLDRYLEIAFDSVFITLRTELKNAIVKGIKSDIERAARALRARWDRLTARASEGYPCEEARRLGNHRKDQGELGTLYVEHGDEGEGIKNMFDKIKVVTDNGGVVNVWAVTKSSEVAFGEPPVSSKPVLYVFKEGDLDFKGLHASNNSEALAGPTAQIVVASTAYITNRGDDDGPLPTHIDNSGRHCQVQVYVNTTFRLHHSVLFGSGQNNFAVQWPDDTFEFYGREGPSGLPQSFAYFAAEAGYRDRVEYLLNCATRRASDVPAISTFLTNNAEAGRRFQPRASVALETAATVKAKRAALMLGGGEGALANCFVILNMHGNPTGVPNVKKQKGAVEFGTQVNWRGEPPRWTGNLSFGDWAAGQGAHVVDTSLAGEYDELNALLGDDETRDADFVVTVLCVAPNAARFRVEGDDVLPCTLPGRMTQFARKELLVREELFVAHVRDGIDIFASREAYTVFEKVESTGYTGGYGYQRKARRSGPGGVTWPFRGDTTASTRPSRPRRGRSQSLPPPTAGTSRSRSRGRSMPPAGSA